MKNRQCLQEVGEKWERVGTIKKLVFKSDHFNDKAKIGKRESGNGEFLTTDGRISGEEISPQRHRGTEGGEGENSKSNIQTLEKIQYPICNIQTFSYGSREDWPAGFWQIGSRTILAVQIWLAEASCQGSYPIRPT